MWVLLLLFCYFLVVAQHSRSTRIKLVLIWIGRTTLYVIIHLSNWSTNWDLSGLSFTLHFSPTVINMIIIIFVILLQMAGGDLFWWCSLRIETWPLDDDDELRQNYNFHRIRIEPTIEQILNLKYIIMITLNWMENFQFLSSVTISLLLLRQQSSSRQYSNLQLWSLMFLLWDFMFQQL